MWDIRYVTNIDNLSSVQQKINQINIDLNKNWPITLKEEWLKTERIEFTTEKVTIYHTDLELKKSEFDEEWLNTWKKNLTSTSYKNNMIGYNKVMKDIANEIWKPYPQYVVLSDVEGQEVFNVFAYAIPNDEK